MYSLLSNQMQRMQSMVSRATCTCRCSFGWLVYSYYEQSIELVSLLRIEEKRIERKKKVSNGTV